MLTEDESRIALNNGYESPILTAERQLLRCMTMHGCRTDEISGDMLSGTHRRIFDAIADIEATGLPPTPANIAAMLEMVPGVDMTAIRLALGAIIREPCHPEMFSVYVSEIRERSERMLLEAYFQEGLNLCRSQASVSELRQHAAGLLELHERAPDPIVLVSGPQLAQMDTSVRFAVDDMIVAGQPLMLVGPKKSLKTNISVDLTISLATGLPFLGKYRVPRPMRAALMSAESGAATIKETAHRVAMAKGLDGVQDAPDALFAFQTPIISTAKECERFRRIIERNRLEFINIDPSYLAFAIGDAGQNLFRMGELLAPLSRIGQETGCTIALSHHARKGTGKDGQPLDLGDESYSGFSEWARQWLFLSRREPYDESHPGSHRLWLRWGGSAGHSGLIGLDIDEGSRKDPWGRRWDVRILNPDAISAQREEAMEESRHAKRSATVEKHLQAVQNALSAFPDGESASMIAAKAGLSNLKCKSALVELAAGGIVMECELVKAGRTYQGWTLVRSDNRTT